VRIIFTDRELLNAPLEYSLLMKLILSLLIALSLNFAQANDIPLSKVTEHLLKLKEMQSQIGQKSSLDIFQSVDNYVLNLASIIEEKLRNNETLLPYELNLIGESLKTEALIHKQILDETSNLSNQESLFLACLQLESFNTIFEMFFDKRGLRVFSLDQINQIPEYKNLQLQIFAQERLEEIESEILKGNITSNFAPLKAFQIVQSGKHLVDAKTSISSSENFGERMSGIPGFIGSSISRGFGAVAGPIQWKKHGGLHQNPKLLRRLDQTLKPFDIVFERKAYKLTDYTIPGHWGHAGVYLGTKEQLQELNLWDLDSLKPFQKNIEEGKVIFQVRREGLVFNKITEFIDLDEMAVVRVKELAVRDHRELEMMVNLLMSQNGKSYDYSFDVMTTSLVTCTEIIAFSYGEIKWPTTPIMGRQSFTPNNVVELLFYKNSPLEFVFYSTGYGNKLNDKSAEDFARTVNFIKHQGQFKQHSITYDREFYRPNRGAMKIRTKKIDHYNVLEY